MKDILTRHWAVNFGASYEYGVQDVPHLPLPSASCSSDSSSDFFPSSSSTLPSLENTTATELPFVPLSQLAGDVKEHIETVLSSILGLNISFNELLLIAYRAPVHFV